MSSFDELLNNTKELTLVGYYGAHNFGDDLMLKGLIDKLRAYQIKINIMAYGEIPWLSSKTTIKCWIKGGGIINFKIFSNLTQNSSLVIWGGGTCFTDEDGDGFFKYMLYSKIMGKKIAYYGVGIGNLKQYIRKMKTITLINLADYISFRDEKSFIKGMNWHIASKYSIEKVEDLSIEVLKKIAYKNEKERDVSDCDYLLIAWRNLQAYNNGLRFSTTNIAKYALYICEEYNLNKIVIIDTDNSEDTCIGTQIESILLKNTNRVSVQHIKSSCFQKKLQWIAEAKVIITSRLHVAMVADYCKILCYVYDYSPKIQYFVESCMNQDIRILDSSTVGESFDYREVNKS